VPQHAQYEALLSAVCRSLMMVLVPHVSSTKTNKEESTSFVSYKTATRSYNVVEVHGFGI
jgi:hypothetical protein